MPLDANGYVRQSLACPQLGGMASRGPPLYGEHILDQPCARMGELLAGSQAEMNSAYNCYTQPGSLPNSTSLDESSLGSTRIAGYSIDDTSADMGGPLDVTSGCYSLRGIDYSNLTDLSPSCTATEASHQPPNSPVLLPDYVAVNPAGHEDPLDEDRGLSEALAGCCAGAEPEKDKVAELAGNE